MKSYLKRIDTETNGNRYDVTPLFANADDFRELIKDLANPFQGSRVEAVACVDALGFVLGAAVAIELGAGVITIRKGGKLPSAVIGRDFVDYTYGTKRLELRRGLMTSATRILVVDDWIETGAQVRAAIDLVESEGGSIVGVAAIRIERNDATNDLAARYPTHSVWSA